MIGIFGGTFDPVHNGHLRIALDVQQALSLDGIHFVPCGEPSHRDKPVATGLQRLAMLRAATKGQAGFIVDDREINRTGPSYMFDTLTSIKQQYPHEVLCLLLGSDAFSHLPSWHCWEQLFNYAHIVVMQRPEMKTEFNDTVKKLVRQRETPAEKLSQRESGNICFVPVTQLDISSTVIRQQWQQGKDVRFFLPDDVISLMKQQDIYD